MDFPDLQSRRQVRDRLVNRVSAIGQLSALVAMASTGVTAGVLAHDAQVKDQQVAQAKAAVREQPSPAPVVVRLVPKPIRTVVVRAAAPAAKALPRKAPARRTSVRVATHRVVRAAPRRVVQAPRAAAPRPATKPAATTTSGS